MAIHWAEEDPEELKAQQRKEALGRRRTMAELGLATTRMSSRQWLAFVGVLVVLMAIGLGLLVGVTEPSLLAHALSPFSCGSCSVLPRLTR